MKTSAVQVSSGLFCFFKNPLNNVTVIRISMENESMLLHHLMQRSGETVIVSHMIRLHYEFLIIHTVWEFPSLISLNWENMLCKDSHL